MKARGQAAPPGRGQLKTLRYQLAKSGTLTTAQRKAGGFAPTAFRTRAPFRVKSTRTSLGYSTGYHEAAVTTDHLYYLRDAVNNLNGTHTLPRTSKASYFGRRQFGGLKVDSVVLGWILQHADGFRTDTAQTILSAPSGQTAGHSGSGLSQVNQGAAHDLLRQKIMDLVKLKHTTPGLTEDSLIVIFGSITVTSMAPGELARATLKGGTAGLKGGDEARDQWEARRNQAKERVQQLFDLLSKPEQDFVHQHAVEFLRSTDQGSTTGRLIRRGRSNSLSRDDSQVSSAVAGRGYRHPSLAPPQGELPPANRPERGAYITEPFRARR